MAKDINIRTLFTADDQLSPQMLKIKQNTKDFIASERSQHRQLNFMLNETGGAVADLSNTFGGPAGLGKAITGVGNNMSQFSFLMQGLNDTVGQGTGKVAGMVQAMAPYGLAVGAAVAGLIAIVELNSELNTSLEKAHERFRNATDGITDFDKAYMKLVEDSKTSLPVMDKISGIIELIKAGSELGGLTNVAALLLGKKIEAESLDKDAQLMEDENKLQAEQLKTRDNLKNLSLALLDVEKSRILLTEDYAGSPGGAQAQLSLMGQQITALRTYRNTLEQTGGSAMDLAKTDKQILDLMQQQKKTQIDMQFHLNTMIADSFKHANDFSRTLKPDVMLDANGKVKSLSPIKTSPIPLDSIKKDIHEMEAMERAAAEQWRRDNEFVLAGLGGGFDSAISKLTEGFDSSLNEWAAKSNNVLASFVAGVISAMEQLASRKAAIAGIAALGSLIPGVGTFAEIFKFLNFHTGGMIPKAHSGMDFRSVAPSKEFPVMVRGGEMVLTEAQQKAVGNQSITVNVSAIDVNSFRNMLRSTDMRSVLVQALSGQINSGRV